MNLISREELKAKLDRGDIFKLVMALSEWHYRAKHIPGSICVSSPRDPNAKMLNLEDEIVVYCSDVHCIASSYAYEWLEKAGFKKLSRYEGGISAWEEARYPLEGDWAE